MKILIGFEKSQAICIAFRNAGHEAYSCDLEPCSGGYPEWHYQCDVLQLLNKNWDAMIMHPECTAVVVSGNAHYAQGKPKFKERLRSAIFIQDLWDKCTSVCNYVCFENPVGVIPTLTDLPKPQYIQPYNFGHCESKKTGLFLHGFSNLTPTQRVYGRMVDGVERFDNQTDSGQNKLSPSAIRAELRSKTYPGIAKAMAEQWGGIVK